MDSSETQNEKADTSTDEKTITVTDSYGREVTVPYEIEHTICIGAGTLRYLSYLGEQGTIVGVEDIEQWEESVEAPERPYRIANPQFGDSEKYPFIGAFRGKYDAESILTLSPAPDVIFYSYSNAEDADKLSSDVGIPVVGLNDGNTGDENMKQSLRIMGQVMDREQRASEVITFFEEEIAELNERTKDEETVNAYIAGVSYRGSHGILSTQPDYPPFEYVNVNNVGSSVSKTGDWEGYQIGDDALFQWDSNPGIDYIFIDLGTYDFSENGNTHTNEKYGIESFATGGVYAELDAAKAGRLYGVIPYNWYSTNHGNVLADAWYVGKVVYPSKFEDTNPQEKANEIYSFLYAESPENEDIYETMTDNFGHGFGQISFE
ncbi:ABC transporter substrate-binding protein [Methanohalophilus mahii]|uniref:Periplasmic binding protein n=1 Tax=Methanohalophilus mahii (strain ATCC 35705 / DSM 5219 / SLP) TaxID=547558 RepID=D5EAC1_METMS|nr:ABC transporter substrate-binding protein [Methanohalophilus mahii]ADE36122.1 periplasmic binding protein [Methanohalophilus mahii DSM 5219]